LAVSRPLAGRVRGAGIGVLVLLAAISSSAPAAGAAKPQVVVSDFGVAASVKLSKPLARAAATSPVGAGLGIGIGHRDRSFSGLALRGSAKLKAKVRGKLADAVAFTSGRTAWFFAEDSKAASIERVGVGSYGLSGKVAGARASYVWSDQALLGAIFGDKSLFVFVPELLKIVTPPTRTDAQACAQVQRQIRLADKVLQDDPSHFVAVKSWIASARAHLARHCGPTSRPGGGGKTGQEEGGAPGEGTPGGGPPGPLTNQAPSATQEDGNAFPGKIWVAKSFDAKTEDVDGQVVSWSWDWGDGSSTAGTGADPATVHTYAKPRIYEVRLTITDDKGASSTATTQVPIGAGGWRTIEQGIIDITCPDGGNTPAKFTFDVRIPSYAEQPTAEVRPGPEAPKGSKLCADTVQDEETERVIGNTLGEIDEWGNLKDTFRVHVTLWWIGPAPGNKPASPMVTATWE
jgi:hypothetical protein